MVKALDGCGLNDSFWIFAAVTTNVEFTLRVRDTHTGEVKLYFNPQGRPADALTDECVSEVLTSLGLKPWLRIHASRDESVCLKLARPNGYAEKSKSYERLEI